MIKFTDGEPYELSLPKPKLNASEIIKNDKFQVLINTSWDPTQFTNDYKFCRTVEEKFLDYIGNNLNSNIETRLNIVNSLYFFSDSFTYSGFNSKIPEFIIAFCKDSNWGIRRTCTLQIPQILPKIRMHIQEEISEAFKSLLKDRNFLVKQSALSKLGEFLYNSSKFPVDLLDQILTLSKSDSPQISELSHYLPGLFRKFPKHREIFIQILLALLENFQSAIRAKSASTLGFFISNLNRLENNSLVAIYINLLKDVDFVKIQAIQHLGLFLQNIDGCFKHNFLGTFKRIQTYNLNWRVNKTIARTLIKIARNIGVNLWMQELWTIGIALCHSSAEVVRVKAGKAVGYLIRDIWGIQCFWDEEIRKDIEKMMDESYKIRVTLAFVLGVCTRILWAEQLFLRLCNDKIVNVRVACAVVVNENNLIKFKSVLANDVEKDVREKLLCKWRSEDRSKWTLCPCKEVEITQDFEVVFSNNPQKVLENRNSVRRIGETQMIEKW